MNFKVGDFIHARDSWFLIVGTITKVNSKHSGWYSVDAELWRETEIDDWNIVDYIWGRPPQTMIHETEILEIFNLQTGWQDCSVKRTRSGKKY